MTTSRSGVLVLLLLAGLGLLVVLVSLFAYGSRYLRLVAEAEQYLANQRPVEVVATSTEATLAPSEPELLEPASTTPATAPLLN